MKADKRHARWLAVGMAMGLPAVAGAQQAPDAAAPVPPRIEIQGAPATGLAARRDAVAATVVVPRDELLRHGDTRLADALRRVPGVSVAHSGGRAEVRLSGLGGGYTQLLLNGEPVPPGFSLETISPELVERVEVSRAASVEQSQQAIAGSINIVLRRVARSSRQDLKLGLGSHLGRAQASADLGLGDQDGALAWGLGLGLVADAPRWPMAIRQTVTDANGQTVQAYRTDKQEGGRDDSLTLSPRATWTLSEHQSLSTDHLLSIGRELTTSRDLRSSEAGAPPTYADDLLQLHPLRRMLRSRLAWNLTEDDQTTWELKAGFSWLRRDVDADFNGYGAQGQWLRSQHVSSQARDGGWDLAGRWRRPMGEAHALAAGFDADQKRRQEDRVQRDLALPGGIPVENLDEVYDARVRRLALFGQDEWTLSPSWQATLGLRWEGLQTDSSGNVFDAVASRVSVFSPVLQARYQAPGSTDQWRVGLSRSYKPPTPRDLMPRRYVTADNTPTTPNWQGNPTLQPELAWGLDAGWERALGKGSQIGLNAYLKRVDDVIGGELLQQDGVWVFRRANQGKADLWGATLDAQIALRELAPEAPDMDLRASLSWNHSRMRDVPGPDNRLAEQSPLGLTLSVDHRVAGTGLSWGSSFAWQSEGTVKLGIDRWAGKSPSRVLDAYALWRSGPATQWRLSLGNLLDADELTTRRVRADGLDHGYNERLRTGATIRLGLEHRL